MTTPANIAALVATFRWRPAAELHAACFGGPNPPAWRRWLEGDEGGWILETKSEAGFVVCIVSSGAREDDSLFYMLVARYSGATERVGQIVEALLKDAPEITDLEVEHD